MSSIFIDLAEALKTLLNEHEFSAVFAAERIYDPLRKLEELETLRVDVVLGDRKQTPLTRVQMQNTIRVEVVVRQVIKGLAGSDQEREALDALVALVEEVDDYISLHANRRLPTAPWAVWQGSELVYPFLPRQLREARQFTSIVRQTYFVATKPDN